jgi:hypothetical protein
MLAKHALSQLSYGPVPDNGEQTKTAFRRLVVRILSSDIVASPCVAAPRVAKGEAWWAWEDLNFRPHAYQARALTN